MLPTINRSFDISTTASSDASTAAAINTMFECDICCGVHFSEDIATVDGCAHSFCFDALLGLGGLQIPNIAHALSLSQSCVRYYYPSNEIPSEAKSQDSSEEFQ